MRLVFDIETTLIPENRREFPAEVHCIVARDLDTNEEHVAVSRADQEAMILLLNRAELLVGHNIAKFDVPVLEHHFPRFRERTGKLYDTLAASRLIYISNLYDRSIKFRMKAGYGDDKREARMPKRLLGSHSLEAWGYRLGEPKAVEEIGDPAEFFGKFSDQLLQYCRQDVVLNAKLFHHLVNNPAAHGWPVMPVEAVVNDSEVMYVIGLQERNGIGFDVDAAEKLTQELVGRRAQLVSDLQEAFPFWYAPQAGQKAAAGIAKLEEKEDAEALALAYSIEGNGCAAYTVPAATRVMRKGYDWPVYFQAGAAYTKIAPVTFNPASPKQRGEVLERKYGWKATEFTDTGDPCTGEADLAPLPYPEIPLLLEFLMVNKRLGQLAEGAQGWLNQEQDGRIHGTAHVTGTRTSRMSHTSPNLAQVPRVGSPYGAECRALFGPTRPGWVQVGADAAGIELRMLAHRLAYFDDGEFAKTLLEGDVHATWQALTGLYFRDSQKTFTYAMLYGAGDTKLGLIVLDDWRRALREGVVEEEAPDLDHARALGADSKGQLLKGLPALELLIGKCHAAHERGWIRGLDGRILACKSEHGALNDLLQSDGAIVMKHALLLFWERVSEGFGSVWAPMLNVHDEWQIEADPHYADDLGCAMVDCMVEAGERLKVRCPLDGEFKIGNTWKETH